MEGQVLGETGEIAVCGENCGLAARGGGANQKIDCRSGDARAAALIIEKSGLFVVAYGQRFVRKCPQILSQSFELGWVANPRQNLLANRTQKQRAALPNEFRKFLPQGAFGRAQIC